MYQDLIVGPSLCGLHHHVLCPLSSYNAYGLHVHHKFEHMPFFL